MAKPSPQVAIGLSSRSPASAGPALRDSRVHTDTDRVLRHRAAAPARHRLFGILVENGDGRALAERPAVVHLAVAGFRSDRQRAVSALTQAPRSDQSNVAAGL